MLKKISVFLVFTIFLNPAFSFAKDQIRAVGSSTVYPFVTVAAEEFGRNSDFKAPIVESTGTGGGFKIFCAGADGSLPDLSNASRAIKKSEKEICAKNGVADIIEIKLGYDGIVVANAVGAPLYEKFTKEHLFLALAKKIPSGGKLIDNPHKKWSDIDSILPDKKIEVYGPPPTSGTRDAFVELVMEKVCEDLPEFKAAYPEKNQRKKACHFVREDGHYIDSGENDNLIVQKLKANLDAVGIFGYSFLDQNESVVQGSMLNGVSPTFENIADGLYLLSRPLFVYAKKANIGKTVGLKEFIKELISENAVGEDGYLTAKGLIPLSLEESERVRKDILKQL